MEDAAATIRHLQEALQKAQADAHAHADALRVAQAQRDAAVVTAEAYAVQVLAATHAGNCAVAASVAAGAKVCAPSTFASADEGGWRDRLHLELGFHGQLLVPSKDTPGYLAGRSLESGVPPPPAIMVPAFGALAEATRAPVPAGNDMPLQVAKALVEVLTLVYSDAEFLGTVVNRVLQHLLHPRVLKPYDIKRATGADRTATTAGSVLTSDGRLLFNVEYKLEMVADAFMEQLQYYVKASSATHQPALLMCCSGPVLELAAGYWASGRPCIQSLYMTRVVFVPERAVELASMLAAIPACLDALEKFKVPAHGLPCPLDVPGTPAGRINFFAPACPALGHDRLLYHGHLTTQAGDDVTRSRVVVKFVRSYNVEAHTFAASMAFAPKLHAYLQLQDGWYAVVMDACVSTYSWHTLRELLHGAADSGVRLTEEQRASIKQKVLDACGAYHRAGFVHGDLHRDNIMVKLDPCDNNVVLGVVATDFDFAGRIDKAQYPAFLSSHLLRVEGVRRGALITCEHDTSRLEREMNSSAAHEAMRPASPTGGLKLLREALEAAAQEAKEADAEAASAAAALRGQARKRPREPSAAYVVGRRAEDDSEESSDSDEETD